MKPGLYDKDNNLIYTWEEMIKNESIIVNDSITNDKHRLNKCCFNGHTLVLSDEITIIGSRCFEYSILDTIYLSKNISALSEHAFDNCYIKNIKVDPENKKYCDYNGVLYNKNINAIEKYPLGKTEDTYIIEKGTKIIRYGCFSGNNNIRKIMMPNSLEEIGKEAFMNCRNLEELYLSSNLKHIGTDIVFDCNNFTTIKYPKSSEEFKIINGYISLFSYSIKSRQLICDYKLTLEELINAGKSLQNANKILKNYEEKNR